MPHTSFLVLWRSRLVPPAIYFIFEKDFTSALSYSGYMCWSIPLRGFRTPPLTICMKITLHLQKVADFYHGFTRTGNGAACRSTGAVGSSSVECSGVGRCRTLQGGQDNCHVKEQVGPAALCDCQAGISIVRRQILANGYVPDNSSDLSVRPCIYALKDFEEGMIRISTYDRFAVPNCHHYVEPNETLSSCP